MLFCYYSDGMVFSTTPAMCSIPVATPFRMSPPLPGTNFETTLATLHPTPVTFAATLAVLFRADGASVGSLEWSSSRCPCYSDRSVQINRLLACLIIIQSYSFYYFYHLCFQLSEEIRCKINIIRIIISYCTSSSDSPMRQQVLAAVEMPKDKLVAVTGHLTVAEH